MLSIMMLLFTVSMFAGHGKDYKHAQNKAQAVADTVAKAISAIPDTAKVTFTKVYNDMKSGIAGMAAALKVGAEHVYVVLVKQQVVIAVTRLLFLLLLIVSAIVLYRIARRNYTICKKEGDDIDECAPGVAAIICSISCGVVGIITLVSLVNSLESIVMGFANPEYGAIMTIMHFVK